MKIYDVSLLEKSLQQVRNVLLRTHNGLEDFEFETQEAFADDISAAIYNERVSGMFIAGICLTNFFSFWIFIWKIFWNFGFSFRFYNWVHTFIYSREPIF